MPAELFASDSACDPLTSLLAELLSSIYTTDACSDLASALFLLLVFLDVVLWTCSALLFFFMTSSVNRIHVCSFTCGDAISKFKMITKFIKKNIDIVPGLETRPC